MRQELRTAPIAHRASGGLMREARHAFERIGGFKAFHIVLALLAVTIVAIVRGQAAHAKAKTRSVGLIAYDPPALRSVGRLDLTR